MKGDSMTGGKFPVFDAPRKRRRRARRPSFPAPASLRLGAVDATVARDLIGKIYGLSGGRYLALLSVADRLSRIEALASDLSEIIDRAEVRA